MFLNIKQPICSQAHQIHGEIKWAMSQLLYGFIKWCISCLRGLTTDCISALWEEVYLDGDRADNQWAPSPRLSSSPPLSLLWEKYLTWQEVRMWHSCTSSLLVSSAQLPHLPTDSLQVLVPEQSESPGPRSEPGEIMWLIVLAGLLHCASAYDVDLKKLDGLAKAKVEVQ